MAGGGKETLCNAMSAPSLVRRCPYTRKRGESYALCSLYPDTGRHRNLPVVFGE
jgi:hypothetical protein